MTKISTLDKNKRYYESTQEKLESYANFRPDVDNQK